MSVAEQFTPRSRLSCVTPDDIRLDLRCDGDYFSNPCDTTIKVMPKVLDGRRPDGLQVQDLHVAYAGNYDGVMRMELDARIVERLAYSGGEILVARSSRPELQGLAIWRGPFHEVASWLPSELESEGLLHPVERFTPLHFADSPEGLRVTPRSAELTVQTVEVVTDIDGIGTLFMYPGASGLARVPTWKGQEVGVGEVWRTQVQNSSESPVLQRFTLASSTMVSLLAADPVASTPFTAQLKFISALTEMSSSNGRQNGK